MAIIKSGSQPDLYPDNDWYDMVYRGSAPMTEHNISVSGGGDTRYFVSGTFFDQSSLIPGSELDRYSFRANTERDFGERLTVGTNVSFVREDIDRAGAFSTTDLNRMTPLTVARHSDGSWGSITGGKVSSVLAENNPLRRIAEYGWQKKQRETFIGSLNASYKITDDLSIRGIGSYKSYSHQQNTFDNEVDPITNFLTKEPINSTRITPNKLTSRWDRSTTLMLQAFATYEKDFGKHYVKAMAGVQYEDSDIEFLEASRKSFPSNQLGSIDGGSNSAENLGNAGLLQEESFMSEFGRINYSYDGKYLLEANVRHDVS